MSGATWLPRGRSCETQLLGYVDETTEALERGCQVDTIVLDFSKAFDKVSHALLVHKLKCYGVRGLTGAWIEDLLSERQQAVVVEGATSEYAPVESGVPQAAHTQSIILRNLIVNTLNTVYGLHNCVE